mmetsp:Transcript_8576/g.35896  ORF Transcript_8576/g.35896 Transcript_8576/m.35896 type:complete len:230 (+) Transcript_8576:2705-3394(+)
MCRAMSAQRRPCVSTNAVSLASSSSLHLSFRMLGFTLWRQRCAHCWPVRPGISSATVAQRLPYFAWRRERTTSSASVHGAPLRSTGSAMRAAWGVESLRFTRVPPLHEHYSTRDPVAEHHEPVLADGRLQNGVGVRRARVHRRRRKPLHAGTRRRARRGSIGAALDERHVLAAHLVHRGGVVVRLRPLNYRSELAVTRPVARAEDVRHERAVRDVLFGELSRENAGLRF